jgi:hypothetical protein
MSEEEYAQVYALWGGGKEQESIHYQLQKNLSYMCVCVCVCILIVDVVYVMGFELLQMQMLLS